jgi:hypothetical protein
LSILSLIHKLASYGVKGQEAPQKTIAEIALVFEHGNRLMLPWRKWDDISAVVTQNHEKTTSRV